MGKFFDEEDAYPFGHHKKIAENLPHVGSYPDALDSPRSLRPRNPWQLPAPVRQRGVKEKPASIASVSPMTPTPRHGRFVSAVYSSLGARCGVAARGSVDAASAETTNAPSANKMEAR